MSPSVFLDRSCPPGAAALEAVLGKTNSLWTELRAGLAAEFAPLTDKWSFSGKSHGWILQLRQKRRTVLYLVPCPGYFVASFALSDRACQAVSESRLPVQVRELVQRAPQYPEGRAVRLDVRTKKDVATVMGLAAIKMSDSRRVGHA